MRGVVAYYAPKIGLGFLLKYTLEGSRARRRLLGGGSGLLDDPVTLHLLMEKAPVIIILTFFAPSHMINHQHHAITTCKGAKTPP